MQNTRREAPASPACSAVIISVAQQNTEVRWEPSRSASVWCFEPMRQPQHKLLLTLDAQTPPACSLSLEMNLPKLACSRSASSCSAPGL